MKDYVKELFPDQVNGLFKCARYAFSPVNCAFLVNFLSLLNVIHGSLKLYGFDLLLVG